MLLNLGLAADAAAAHENGFSAPQTGSQLAVPEPNPSSPSFSIATLPSLAIGSLYDRCKPFEVPQGRRKISPRSMSDTLVEILSSSDDEVSTAALDLARPLVPPTGSAKKSSRPKTSYQLAHPASNARHKRLRLRPKLLLQLQQTSQTPRPIPMLDVLPSTGYFPPLARRFPSIFRGKDGLGPNDLIVVRSELYERTVSGILDRSWGLEEEGDDHREVVATICQIFKDDALSKGKVEICLNHGPAWEATPLPNGSYEFVAYTRGGVQTMRWVLRAKSRRVSAPPGLLPPEDSKRFTFSVIDPNTRRHPVIASMTRNHLEVFDQYSKPAPSSAFPTSPTSAMSVISDSSEMDVPLGKNVVETDDDLRTLIVITGIWVAFREGWSRNFSYDDSLNSKANCCHITSKSGSTAPVNDENSAPVEGNGSSNGADSNKGKKRQSSSGAFRSPSEKHRSIGFGASSKRSNSTGAAFMERVNRRSASAGLNRHSTLSNAHANGNGVTSPGPPQQDTADLGTRSRLTKVDLESRTSTPDPGQALGISRNGEARQWQQPEASQERRAIKASNGRAAEPSTTTATTSKRRHRLSNLFDCIIKKRGHH